MKKSEVLELIGVRLWPEFQKFMKGQTVGYHKGEIDYYSDDVKKFIDRFKIQKKEREILQ